ncbi:MAG: hypothetical protein AAGI24_10480 [Pseudomonadota bacterium]
MVEFVDIGAVSKRLTQVGIPEPHAESIVRVIADTLNQVSDRLVSRDYLDMRLLEQRAYMDKRFLEERAVYDAGFASLEGQISTLRVDTDRGFERLEHKINILFLMVGLSFTVQIIPALKVFFAP